MPIVSSAENPKLMVQWRRQSRLRNVQWSFVDAAKGTGQVAKTSIRGFESDARDHLNQCGMSPH
jgi:hypothetical protein